MSDCLKTPNLIKMQELLMAKKSNGMRGLRLFVSDSRDLSLDDLAGEFCRMEESRSDTDKYPVEHTVAF